MELLSVFSISYFYPSKTNYFFHLNYTVYFTFFLFLFPCFYPLSKLCIWYKRNENISL